MTNEPAPVRVLHLVSHPIQYFAPLYRELARRPEVELVVVFCSDASIGEYADPGFGRRIAWNTDLLGGYESVIPASARGRAPNSRFLTTPQWDILRMVAKRDYDVLWVHGYAHLTTWLSWAIAVFRRKPFLLREEQTLLRRRSGWRRLVKRAALPLMFRRAIGLFIGEENRRYLREYGVQEQRLYPAPYAVDNTYLRAAEAALRPKRDDLRRELGVSDDAPVVLFVGKLIPTKNPLILLDAFAEVRREHPCWLLFIGDGVLRTEIEERSRARSIPNVIVAGFRNQTELPGAYSAADVFVLPSRLETWGLVVNESLNFGLPVVVSDRVGCASDLVASGRNGFVVPHDDHVALARAIDQLVRDRNLRRVFGAEGRRIVADYSVARCADGIVRAAATGCGRCA